MGLYECHGHIILDGVSYNGAVARHRHGVDEALVRRNLEICAERGVVFYRDGGDRHGVSIFAKSIAGEYGIDYRTPAYIIHKKGHYGGMFGRAFESMSEYRMLVAEALRLSADFIKTTASGLLDFAQGGRVTGPALAFSELSEMIYIAHCEGVAVMVHANGADNIMCAADSGADSIEHGYYMSSSALHSMRENKTVWVPTCVTALNLIGTGRYDDRVLRRIVESHKTMLIEASSMGIPVACGSDAGASCVPQGSGTLDELAVLESLGIDPEYGNRKISVIFNKDIQKCINLMTSNETKQ